MYITGSIENIFTIYFHLIHSKLYLTFEYTFSSKYLTHQEVFLLQLGLYNIL